MPGVWHAFSLATELEWPRRPVPGARASSTFQNGGGGDRDGLPPPPPRAGARAARRTPTSPSGRCYAGEATRYPPQTRPTESRRARAQALPAGALPKKGARHPREGTGAGHLRIEAGCHYGARAGPVRNGVLRDWTETTALPRAPSCFADALLPQCNVQARSSHRHTHTHTMMTMFPLEPRCLRIRRVRYCSKYAR